MIASQTIVNANDRDYKPLNRCITRSAPYCARHGPRCPRRTRTQSRPSPTTAHYNRQTVHAARQPLLARPTDTVLQYSNGFLGTSNIHNTKYYSRENSEKIPTFKKTSEGEKLLRTSLATFTHVREKNSSSDVCLASNLPFLSR